MSAANATPFHGIYPSIICPLNADYSIDEAALAKHIAAVTDVPGIVGILCNGHAGENFSLTRRERRRVTEVSRRTLDRHMIVVAGVNCENSLEAVVHAQDAKVAGADAVMVFAPNSWSMTQDETMAINHHRMIAEAVDIPIMLFQGSVRAGRTAYMPDILSRLVKLPNVVAIKEGSWETCAYEATRRLVKDVAPQVAIMASGDEHLFTCYVLGSEGSLVSLAVLIPETIVALDQAVRRGDLLAARAAHDIIYPLARAIYGAPPPGHATARLKTCLKLLGRIESDVVRPPIGPLANEEVAMLQDALEVAGLL